MGKMQYYKQKTVLSTTFTFYWDTTEILKYNLVLRSDRI